MLFKKKTQVILDTNFLIMPGSRGVDVFSEIDKIMSESYELCVMDKTIQELENLVIKHGKKKESFNAKLGLILLKQKNLKTLAGSSGEYVDNAILAYAASNPEHVVVATQDKELREKLKKLSVRVIQLRQEKYLVLG